VALSGKTVARVAEGIVTSIVPGADAKSPAVLDTDIPSTSIMSGSPLIDTNGSLVGIETGVADQTSGSAFMTASAIITSVSTPAGSASQ